MLKLVGLLVSLLLFNSGCFSPDTPSSQAIQEFRFAASGEFVPFSYVNEQGELTGFDIEVGQAIAHELKLKPVASKYKFPALIEGIKTGRFDAAVASHTVTPARKVHVHFSLPYYYSGPQIFVRPNSTVQTGTDLKSMEIAVSKGSTYVDEAIKWSDKIKVYDSDLTALNALNRGRHDAVITDFVTGAMAIKKGLKLEARQLLGRSEQAIAVAKNRPELLAQINTALTKLKASGKLKALSMKYFGKDITIKPASNENVGSL